MPPSSGEMCGLNISLHTSTRLQGTKYHDNHFVGYLYSKPNKKWKPGWNSWYRNYDIWSKSRQEKENFFFSRNVRIGAGAHSALYPRDTKGSFPMHEVAVV